jgi:hypothetical protein
LDLGTTRRTAVKEKNGHVPTRFVPTVDGSDACCGAWLCRVPRHADANAGACPGNPCPGDTQRDTQRGSHAGSHADAHTPPLTDAASDGT